MHMTCLPGFAHDMLGGTALHVVSAVTPRVCTEHEHEGEEALTGRRAPGARRRCIACDVCIHS